MHRHTTDFEGAETESTGGAGPALGTVVGLGVLQTRPLRLHAPSLLVCDWLPGGGASR